MKTAITSVLLVIALIYWLYFNSSTESKLPTINKVSFQPNDYMKPKSNEPESGLSGKTLKQPTQSVESNNGGINEPLKERSYMTIYKDIRLAKSCNHFYQQNHQSKGEYDYLQVLHNTHNSQYQTKQEAPTNQVQALESWVNQCKYLKSAVFFRAGIEAEFPDFQFAYPVLIELRKEWQIKKPETAAEKHLEKAVKLNQQWGQSINHWSKVSRGDFYLDKEERQPLMDQVYQLNEQIVDIYRQTNNYEITPEIAELQLKIDALNEQLYQRYPVNEAAVSEALKDFNLKSIQVKQALNSGYPYSFVYLMEESLKSQQFSLKIPIINRPANDTRIESLIPGYKTPIEQLYANTKIQDQAVYNLMVEPASNLLLCYMGADCGPDSEWVRNYCLGDDFHQVTYPDACGKSLIDFYTENYLSPNLWLDVSDLFDKLVNYYEI